MKFLHLLIRFLGVLLGGLMLLAVIADALGMAPASGTSGSVAQRLLTAGPVVLAGMLLVLPYARLGARVQTLGAFGLGVFALVLAFLAFVSVQSHLAGDLHWAAIPASLLMLVVVAANAWLLGTTRRRARLAAPVAG